MCLKTIVGNEKWKRIEEGGEGSKKRGKQIKGKMRME